MVLNKKLLWITLQDTEADLERSDSVANTSPSFEVGRDIPEIYREFPGGKSLCGDEKTS